MESHRQRDQMLLKDPDFTKKKMHFVYFAKILNNKGAVMFYLPLCD